MIRTVVRRSAAALTLATLLGLAFLAAGGSASADTPVPSSGNWEPKPQVDDLHAWLIFVGVPVLLVLVVTALILAPPLARGERLFHYGDTAGEGQWLGGPRKAAGELAEPDTEDSAAGGAGGTW